MNSLYVDRILGRVNLIIETLVIITLQGPGRGHTNVIESQHKVAAQLKEDFFLLTMRVIFVLNPLMELWPDYRR